MGEAVDVAKVLVNPTMKLLEMIQGATGKMYDPIYCRKMADAKAYEIQTIGSAIKECSELPVHYDGDKIVIDSTDTADLAQRAQNRMQFQAIKEQQNIEQVIRYAYEKLEHAENVEDSPVDEDWVTRFFNYAKDVTSEKMQYIWGQILAGEICQSGSFSMRTLDVIRNISKNEAKIFTNMLPFILQSGSRPFITAEESILEEYNIQYNDLLLLDECGLMVSDGFISYNPELVPNQEMGIYSDQLIMILTNTDSKNKSISYRVYMLTEAGMELYRILSHPANEEYFYSVIKRVFAKNGPNIKMTVHQIEENHNGGIKYSDAVLQEYKK